MSSEHPYARMWPPDVTIDGIELKCTCGACPEQYEAFLDGKQVGYLRLRHGEFRVDVPDCGGETVYERDADGDGQFTTEERPRFLLAAITAIRAWLKSRRLTDAAEREDGE